MARELNAVVFVGLNSRVAALYRDTGETIWEWRAPKPSSGGYVSLLLVDEKHLIASVNGYTYCIDPFSGEQVWHNDLPGFGTAVATLEAAGRHGAQAPLLAAAAADASRRRSSS